MPYSLEDLEPKIYIHLPNVYLHDMLEKRFEVFAAQDCNNGRFDVTFELDGKILHAHKFILTSVSATLDSWLTDLWTNKDEPVKIKDYSYDDFYQFVRFLYSGDCEITVENVFNIVDMAEFYGISYLKSFCEDLLNEAMDIITLENIEKMFEFAEKYSLYKFTESVKYYAVEQDICEYENFNAFKKPFIEFLSHYDEFCTKELFFENIYKWAEHRIMKEKAVDNDTNFNLLEAIKIELNTVLSKIKFSWMSFDFLMNFVVEKGFFLSSVEMSKFFFRLCYYRLRKKPFTCLSDLVQKQALLKQKVSPNDNFNLQDSINADLAEIIPLVDFYKLEKRFLMDYIVGNGILTEKQANLVFETKVEVENNGKIISGVFMDNYSIRLTFENKSPYEEYSYNSRRCHFNYTRVHIPSTRSTVMKMKGVEWYLCLEKDGVFTLKHYTLIERSDYLLAQMSNNSEFQLHSNVETRVTFSGNI
uniref:BTB domain-containing protein n=1 Tax=Panagrolaimus sp. ES5 TaxID=591445 RepID=A0AC34G261_9BILA